MPQYAPGCPRMPQEAPGGPGRPCKVCVGQANQTGIISHFNLPLPEQANALGKHATKAQQGSMPRRRNMMP